MWVSFGVLNVKTRFLVKEVCFCWSVWCYVAGVGGERRLVEGREGGVRYVMAIVVLCNFSHFSDVFFRYGICGCGFVLLCVDSKYRFFGSLVFAAELFLLFCFGMCVTISVAFSS